MTPTMTIRRMKRTAISRVLALLNEIEKRVEVEALLDLAPAKADEAEVSVKAEVEVVREVLVVDIQINKLLHQARF